MRSYVLSGLLLCAAVGAQCSQDAIIGAPIGPTENGGGGQGGPCVKKDVILDIVNNMIELTREALQRVHKLAELAKGDNCVGCCQKVSKVEATSLPAQEMPILHDIPMPGLADTPAAATTTSSSLSDVPNKPLDVISNANFNKHDEPTAPTFSHIETMLNKIPNSGASTNSLSGGTPMVYDILHGSVLKPVLYPLPVPIKRPSVYDLNFGRLIVSKPKKEDLAIVPTSRAWDSFLVLFERLIPRAHLDLENGLASMHVLNAFKEYEKSINGHNANDPNKIYFKIAEIRRRLRLLN